MNWDVTLSVFSKGGVSVWEDAASGKPVAYCWGSLNSHDSVMEVRPEYRGQGIGRMLAEFMIDSSLAMHDPLLEIQISPGSAESFWRGMGFLTYLDRGRCYGRRILELRQPLEAGIRRSVTVEFLPPSSMWATEKPTPLACHQLLGIEDLDGKIVLEKAASHFHPLDGADLVIDVQVDGRSRFKGKAKYPEAEAIGVRPCRSGFMIAEIFLASN